MLIVAFVVLSHWSWEAKEMLKARSSGDYHFPSNHVIISGGGACKEKNKLLKSESKNKIRVKSANKNKDQLVIKRG